jgi:capsular exopolysaccharide synthesis family protein
VAPALQSVPNVKALVTALRRRWALAVSLGLVLAALAATAVWFVVPARKYTARTLLHVPPERPWLLKGDRDGGPDPLSHQRTQVALAKSRLVLQSALDDPAAAGLGFAPDSEAAVAWLEDALLIDFSVAPEILRIELSGEDKERLVVLVRAVQKAYLEEIVDSRGKQQRERLHYLKKLRETYDARLRANREAEQRIEQKAGNRDAAARALMLGFLQQQLGSSERELLQAQAELRKARAELTGQRAKAQKLPDLVADDLDVELLIDNEPHVQRLMAEVHDTRQQIERTLAVAQRGEREPKVIQLREQLQTLESTLKGWRKNLHPEAERQARAKSLRDVRASTALLQERITAIESNEKVLASEVGRLRQRLQDVTVHGAKLDVFREDLSHLEAIAKKLVAEEQALKVEMEVPPRVKVLEQPFASQSKSKSRRALLTGMAGAAAFCVVLFGVGWWEHRARRIGGVEEVVEGLGIDLIGTLPPLAARHYMGAAVLPREQVIDCADSTRTMLLSTARSHSARIVMFTSAVGREGKTSLVCQLATSLARAGLKTLILDADLKNPTVHVLFGVPSEPGFSEILRGEAETPAVIRPTPVPGLALLPAGRRDHLTLQALAQGRAAQVFAWLREQYDFIVIDSSPVLPVADALLVGQYVDGVVFSILHEVSRVPNVCAAYQRLTTLGVRILGAVVNGVDGGPYAPAYPYASGTGPRFATRGQDSPELPAPMTR